MASAIFQLRSPADLPIVGRHRESEGLLQVLEAAKSGSGGTWTLEGPVGIGKTRLTKWMEEQAKGRGFSVQTAICLRESMSPLFPWQQIFRRSSGRRPSEGAGGEPTGPALGTLNAPVIMLEVEKGAGVGKWLETAKSESTLFISRDKPTTLKERYPGLSAGIEMLWMTRVEGPGNIHPANIDVLGERVEGHLKKAAGSVVGLEGLEYLVSQSSFSSVYNFLQFLRDLAQEVDGHILVSFRPSAFDKREVALLETLGDVVKEEEKPAAPSKVEEEEETLANVMLRYMDLVEGLAAKQPQLYILEDLQWADPPSMKVLQFLARNVRALPVVIVATIRTEMGGKAAISDLGEGDNPMMQIVENMLDEGCLKRVELGGLKDEDRLKVAEEVVGMSIVVQGGSAEFEGFLDRTDGNPYLIISAMQLLADEGRILRKGDLALVELSRQGKHGEEAFSFPKNVRNAAEERMRNLPPVEQELLAVASVAGQDFRTGAIAAAMAVGRDTVISNCQKLERDKGFLGHLTGNEDKWFFANPVALEAAQLLLTPEKRKVYALSLARWWTQQEPGEVETIARLFHDAGEIQEGLPWVRKALDITLNLGSADMVLRIHHWLQEMMAQGGVPPEDRVREGLEVARKVQSRHGISRAYISMLEELRKIDAPFPIPDLVEARLVRVIAPMNLQAAEERLAALMARYPSEKEDVPLELRTGIITARLEVVLGEGKYHLLTQVADEGLSLLKDGVASPDRSSMLLGKAMGLMEQGYLDEAIPFLDEVKGLEASDEGRTSIVLTLEASWYAVSGRFMTASALFTRSYEISKRVGRVESIVTSLYNRGLLEALLGDSAGARKSLEEARMLVQRFGRIRWLEHLSYLDGEILLSEAKYSEALSVLRPVVEGPDKTNLGEDLPQAGIALAIAFLRTGDPDKAFASLKRVEVGESRVQRASLPRYHRVQGEVEEALGRKEEARQMLLKSIEVAMSVGNKLESGLSRWALSNLEESLGNKEAADRLRAESKKDLDGSELPLNARPK